MSKTVTVIATFEVPDDVTQADLDEFFEFELGYRASLSGANPLAAQDLPRAQSVDVRDW